MVFISLTIHPYFILFTLAFAFTDYLQSYIFSDRSKKELIYNVTKLIINLVFSAISDQNI